MTVTMKNRNLKEKKQFPKVIIILYVIWRVFPSADFPIIKEHSIIMEHLRL